MTKKPAPDWEAIERAYRAGSGSVRAIAEKHGVSESTLRSRAKTYEWVRDLTNQVAAATRTKISRMTSRSSDDVSDAREDEQIVEVESTTRADVVVGQIGRLAFWEGITRKLAASLSSTEVTTENQAEFSRSLNAGVDAELKLIKAQRQAYGIDESTPEEPYESRLARLMADQ